MTGNETPLRLTPGADTLLIRAVRVTAALGAAALSANAGHPALKALLASLLILAWWRVEGRLRRRQNTPLLVFPDGRCRLGQLDAELGKGCWITRRYCVLACRVRGQTRRLVISAARQDTHEYRKLLGWLRLRNPTGTLK